MKKLYKLIPFLILGLVIVRLLATISSQTKDIRVLEEEKKARETSLVKIDNEIGILEDELENVNSLEFIEKVAREKLRMVGPKDLIYIDKSQNEGETESSNQ